MNAQLFLRSVCTFLACSICLGAPHGLHSSPDTSVGVPDIPSLARSFVANDFRGVHFKVQTQWRSGTASGFAPECPQNFMIHPNVSLRIADGVVGIPYDAIYLWGSMDDVSSEEVPSAPCNSSGFGELQVAESAKLRGGSSLKQLRHTFDITKVFDDVTEDEIRNGAVTDVVYRLHQSAWLALRGKQYYTGKMDYDFAKTPAQQEIRGIQCGVDSSGVPRKYFVRGDLFLFIDEPSNVNIQVKTSPTLIETKTLQANQRYMVVVTEDSNCIYNSVGDATSGRLADYDSKGNLEITRAPSTSSTLRPATLVPATSTVSATFSATDLSTDSGQGTTTGSPTTTPLGIDFHTQALTKPKVTSVRSSVLQATTTQGTSSELQTTTLPLCDQRTSTELPPVLSPPTVTTSTPTAEASKHPIMATKESSSGITICTATCTCQCP